MMLSEDCSSLSFEPFDSSNDDEYHPSYNDASPPSLSQWEAEEHRKEKEASFNSHCPKSVNWKQLPDEETVLTVDKARKTLFHQAKAEIQILRDQ